MFFDGEAIIFFGDLGDLGDFFSSGFIYDSIFSFLKGLFSNKNKYIIKYISEFTSSTTFLKSAYVI